MFKEVTLQNIWESDMPVETGSTFKIISTLWWPVLVEGLIKFFFSKKNKLIYNSCSFNFVNSLFRIQIKFSSENPFLWAAVDLASLSWAQISFSSGFLECRTFLCLSTEKKVADLLPSGWRYTLGKLKLRQVSLDPFRKIATWKRDERADEIRGFIPDVWYAMSKWREGNSFTLFLLTKNLRKSSNFEKLW